MKRAYSIVQNIKAMEEGDERVIRGMATTPSVDRMGDIVEPMGVQVAGDIPLFLYHDSGQTVGRAKLGKATKDGIPFEARLPLVKEMGRLRDRVDEAWQMLKYRLITGVSIGFNVLDDAYELMKDGGIRFLKTEVLELSLVPIPANSQALITTVKSICEGHRAALGPPRDPHDSPGASGQRSGAPSGALSLSRSQKGITVKTITQLREERTTKAARLDELSQLWSQADHTKTAEERAEFDALDSEIATIDDEIRLLRVSEIKSAGARTVEGETRGAGAGSRGGPTIIVRKHDPDDSFKGQAFTRFLVAKAMAFIEMHKGNIVHPADVLKHRFGNTNPQLVQWARAAVAGGGTGSGEWGAELVQIDKRFQGDFVEYLYSKTVFDALPLRPMPHNVNIKGQDGAATGYWVGESKAIPVSKADFNDVDLTPLEVDALAVCSQRLIRDSSPSAEMWIRDSIVQASAQRVDTTFLSASAASAGVSPAGILNGLSALSPSGTDAAAVRADYQSLVFPFLTAKNGGGLVHIMTPSMAMALAMMVNALGQTEFPDVMETGGTLFKRPVYTGDNVTPGDWIVLKPSDIWKIGDTGVSVSMSDQATIEMNDAPAGASDTPTAMASHTVSLWQTNSVGFKVTRGINYKIRRSGAVQLLSNGEYGGVVS